MSVSWSIYLSPLSLSVELGVYKDAQYDLVQYKRTTNPRRVAAQLIPTRLEGFFRDVAKDKAMHYVLVIHLDCLKYQLCLLPPMSSNDKRENWGERTLSNTPLSPWEHVAKLQCYGVHCLYFLVPNRAIQHVQTELPHSRPSGASTSKLNIGEQVHQ